MAPELTVLALAGLLQAVQIGLFAVVANRDVGPDYAAGSRDAAPPRPLSVLAGRLQRAMTNHFEALILFGAAVLVTVAAEGSGSYTAVCAWIYLAARVLYVPAYALGLVPWRSVIWAVGFLATLAMLTSALV